MMCPTCDTVFDKKATKGLKNIKPKSSSGADGSIKDQISPLIKEVSYIGHRMWLLAKEKVEYILIPLDKCSCR